MIRKRGGGYWGAPTLYHARRRIHTAIGLICIETHELLMVGK